VTTPLLVFGWGNHSRGDDALGPLCIDRLRALIDHTPAWADTVECLDDYQLQVEHALDMVGRLAVLFVDASLTCTAPFVVTQIAPSRDASYTSHAMSPRALLQVYLDLHGNEPPPCTLLAIRGEHFGLGEPVSPAALVNLDVAMVWAERWIADSLRKLARPIIASTVTTDFAPANGPTIPPIVAPIIPTK
jgi:hydrogenase maturation protease